MKRLFLPLILISFLANAQTGEKNFIDQNYIEVTGKAELEISPDLIYIEILVSEKDNKNKVPLADRERAMISKLKDIGIDTNKDLLIKDISSNFKYYWLTKSEILLAKVYQLVVKDGKTASKVFAALESIDISNVSIEKVDHTAIEKFRKEVKVEAIKAAKSKSEALATAVGQTSGRAIYVQELEAGYRPMTSNVVLRGTSSAVHYGTNPPEPQIDFEKIRLEYSILCRFELK